MVLCKEQFIKRYTTTIKSLTHRLFGRQKHISEIVFVEYCHVLYVVTKEQRHAWYGGTPMAWLPMAAAARSTGPGRTVWWQIDVQQCHRVDLDFE